MGNTLMTLQSTRKPSQLSKLRIDRREHRPEPPNWGKRFLLITITTLAVLGMAFGRGHLYR